MQTNIVTIGNHGQVNMSPPAGPEQQVSSRSPAFVNATAIIGGSVVVGLGILLNQTAHSNSSRAEDRTMSIGGLAFIIAGGITALLGAVNCARGTFINNSARPQAQANTGAAPLPSPLIVEMVRIDHRNATLGALEPANQAGASRTAPPPPNRIIVIKPEPPAEMASAPTPPAASPRHE